ncbi:hypothetical protein [Iningainema tapete]|uniref:Uncharacterized protein n=1 Tax=Iningainema tapete BLCC-T55 TaxID=2748662 RepID=A0A8J6XAJ0_9CYAN|nr:hypothetical protein [Iningainema tapete]MBD2771260.1 hypothetical protein [Iningainema tapete BLCC-T55]
MASIELTIRDDNGNILQCNTTTTYTLNLGGQTFSEIEGAVENWKQTVRTDVERKHLVAAQAQFTQEKKNQSNNM